MFADFANEWLNIQLPTIICIENKCQGGMFASFGGHTILANIPFQETFCFEYVLHMSFSLPGPLHTLFELKLDLPVPRIWDAPGASHSQPSATDDWAVVENTGSACGH